MRTSIRKLVRECGHKIEDTVYREEEDPVLDFQLIAGDFFELRSGLDKGKNYALIDNFYRLFCKKQEEYEVPQWLGLMGELNRLGELKKEKKYVRQRMNENVRKSYEETIEQFGEDAEKLLYLEYKNRVVLTSFSNIGSMIWQLKAVRSDELYQMPVLVTGLSDIRASLLAQEPLGVVGGPCLFGVDEVLLQVITSNGEHRYFDCSGGRNDSNQRNCTLEEYLSSNQEDIEDLCIINRKTGITKQEHRSLLYLFDIAAALKGCVIVPIPDMSYLKYMSSDLSPLRPELFDKTMEAFAREVYKITDIYLEAIDRMKQRYSGLEVTVLHHRNHELCQAYYREREPYIKDSSHVRRLTGISGKKEAVVDYITMPALPYYLFGITNIIQVDSLDETDSGRKCQKLHKGSFHLYSILYPEFISADGVNTIYHAEFTYKEYLNKEDY